MNKIIACLSIGLLPLIALAQKTTLPRNKGALKDTSTVTQAGRFQIGIRGTTSLFSHDEGAPGFGGGGHVRILVHPRINTEWFADVLFTDIQQVAQRQDYHIGWSVMYYILKPKNFHRKVLPYVVAGHCFDWTRITVNTRPNEQLGRFSSAVQAGAGVSFNLTPRWDISFTTQYMLHLGPDVHAHVENGDVQLEEHQGVSWEGHLLLSLSINYKIAQLWKPKK